MKKKTAKHISGKVGWNLMDIQHNEVDKFSFAFQHRANGLHDFNAGGFALRSFIYT